ncbi:MAG: xanthine dehydrogenase accessory protein XdhC [Minwuiales bacterium]|nr:xanthine dehydrogenase accessory protein XdhC [Minwuiales bacterium]
MTAWYDRLASLIAAGVDCVVVTVDATRGSTPREPGARMIVTADSLFGTVGGGNLEYRATEIARRMFGEAKADTVLHDFPLGPSLGQCCGGHATLSFEPFVGVESEPSWIGEFRRSQPPEMTVYLFGAGHVGRALVNVLAGLPCRICWIDPRAGQFPDDLPDNAAIDVSAAPERDVDDAPAGAFFLVMTHSHQLDLQISERILRRGDFAYFGLIGSATKRKRFEARLMRKGIAPAMLRRMTCPIGVDGISGKHPAKIAVAVAAEILQRSEAVEREADFAGTTLSA